MKKRIDVSRAWKDRDYFDSLSPEEQAEIPANPAGLVDLAPEELAAIVGGITIGEGTCGLGSLGCQTTECPKKPAEEIVDDCGCT